MGGVVAAMIAIKPATIAFTVDMHCGDDLRYASQGRGWQTDWFPTSRTYYHFAPVLMMVGLLCSYF